MMKGKKPLTARTTAKMTDEELDQRLLDILPMKLLEIYQHFGAGSYSSRTVKKRVRTRLNTLTDKGDIYTTGHNIGSTIYHKKEKHQENI